MVDLQAIASHLPVTLMNVYCTGRWAHINVKLFHFELAQLSATLDGIQLQLVSERGRTFNNRLLH